LKDDDDDTFNPALENESFHGSGNDNRVRVELAMSNSVIVKRIVSPHINIHKCDPSK